MEKCHRWSFFNTICFGILLALGQCLPTLSPAVMEDLEAVSAQVVVRSSPCSATCGLGMRTEELCLLGQGREYRDCQERRVECLLTWQCGMGTRTVEVGARVDLDCLEAVMEAMGSFRFMFSWRYARGVITTNDALFGRLRVPKLDRVTLKPVREKDAGTYRCDVQDTSFRMVKRAYFGVRVLPAGLLHLDSDVLSKWDYMNSTEGGGPNGTAGTGVAPLYPHRSLLWIVAYALSISVGATVLTFVMFYCMFRQGMRLACKPEQNVHCATSLGDMRHMFLRPSRSVDI